MSRFKTPEELDVFLDAVTSKIAKLEEKENDETEQSEFDKWFYGSGRNPKKELDDETAGVTAP